MEGRRERPDAPGLHLGEGLSCPSTAVTGPAAPCPRGVRLWREARRRADCKPGRPASRIMTGCHGRRQERRRTILMAGDRSAAEAGDLTGRPAYFPF